VSTVSRLRGLGEIAWAFLKLGCLSFGGPIAHLGYLRAALVAFGLLEQWKAPPWLVVIGMAAAGQWALPT
jgi:hypothetical protein